MKSYSWFRFYSEFSKDPKVQSMTEAMQRRLVMFFCLKCSGELGKLSKQELIYALGVTDETFHETLQLFQAKGFIDQNMDVINWMKRQYVTDSSTERVKKFREKQKHKDMKRFSNVSVTPPDTDTDTDTDINNNIFIDDSENQKKKKPTKKATRLSSDWELPQEWGDWAADECGLTNPEIDLQRHKFKDYWLSTAKNAAKVDWHATWRNWIRTYIERKSL